MLTKNSFVPLSLLTCALVLTLGVRTVSAQTYNTTGTTNTSNTSGTVGIPSGYQSNGNGIYYNSSTGTYYNPSTGQYSSTQPTGPASTDASGNYSIPTGYTSSGGGQYYNSNTGLYYDPTTGFYSSDAPSGNTTNSVNPGIPNTGAGGNAGRTVALLILAAIVAVGGIIFMTRRTTATS